MTPELEKTARDLFFRILRDSRDSKGNGGLLPSEAASMAGNILGLTRIEVLLRRCRRRRRACGRQPRAPHRGPIMTLTERFNDFRRAIVLFTITLCIVITPRNDWRTHSAFRTLIDELRIDR